MSDVWRLLDTGTQPAANNMALERVILDARGRNLIPDTLHFLEFTPSVLVGYHQAVELEVDEHYCRRHGIDINRRISGGGAIYVDQGVLGWELVTGKDAPGIPGRLEEIYRLLCEAAIAGLERLGVPARFRPQNDIEVGGRKISGTGGAEAGNALIYHGTVLVDFDVETMIKCLRLPIAKLGDKLIQSFKERVISLREVLETPPPMAVIKQQMAEGFASVLGVRLEAGTLTGQEGELLDQELPRFQSDGWIRGPRRLQDNSLRAVDYKAPGGLIRISLRLDQARRRIKYAFITGDFFAYPERSILDLEATLKNVSSEPSVILQTVRSFFTTHQVQIPGVEPDDFFHALQAAIYQTGSGRKQSQANESFGGR
jgi:lipoate-protein ligase A